MKTFRQTLIFSTALLGLTMAAAAPQPAYALFDRDDVVSERPGSFADLAEKLVPAVVNISTTQNIELQRGPMLEFQFPDLPPGHPFEQFREFFERMQPPEGRVPLERQVTSLGSGFIIDASGIVVTNNHVIEEAEEISVILHDERQFKAEIIGRDPKADIAVLRIDTGEKLPYVEFGDSDKTRVGDWVLAIGNPFGLGGTVTAGIISARARDINAGPFDDFLQTDAAINRGNSGGPMFDTEGRVIGINTAIFSPSGGNIGIGFAVPAKLAKPIISQLVKYGETRRGWLGVRIQNMTDEMAESLGIDDAAGAMVVEVTPGSPAAEAGIEAGDVITSFNGHEISRMRRLPRLVAETEVGSEAEIVILRNGKEKQLEVTLGRLEGAEKDMEERDQAPGSSAVTGPNSIIGMRLEPLDGRMRTEFNLPGDVEGLLVREVERGSEAANRGIRFGDVIMRVNETDVRSIGDFKGALDKAAAAGRGFALLRIYRDGSAYFVTVPTG